jgi:DUF1680 family protein
MLAFPLRHIRLLDGPFARAQRAGTAYVLALEPDRLLAPYRREASLPSPAASYGNWENSGLDGHLCGHYLSATSALWAATGDARLRERAEYVVAALARCQDAIGTGYVGGIPRSAELWQGLAPGRITGDAFSLGDRWVPLYNLHKVFAGLLDAHRHLGSAKALRVVTRLADWWLQLADPLSEEDFEALLRTEFGGMNESFADLAQLTRRGDYLAMARRFAHREILDPLSEGRDDLDGRHANTQIPKAVGYQRVAEVGGDAAAGRAAAFFWERVALHRSVSIGGNSVSEHFNTATDCAALVEHREGPETCNTYNMLKLSRMLFLAEPLPHVLDFYERGLFNHLLSSIHPDRPGLVYFTPLRPRHYRVYSRPELCSWCCVGSGMEAHARYGELVFTHEDGDLFVNLYLPAELRWPEHGLTVRQETGTPAGAETVLRFTAGRPREFTVRLRRPHWARAMRVNVNGRAWPEATAASGYLPLTRTWRDGDRVEVFLEPATRAERLPDGSDWVSFAHGPFVLAARADATELDGLVADDSRMGHVAGGPLHALAGTPVVVGAPEVPAMPRPLDPARLTFELAADGAAGGRVVLEPFHDIHDSRYTVYWPTATPGTLAERRRELRARDAAALPLDERTVDRVAAGEQQPESDHAFTGHDTWTGASGDRHWRGARGEFGYVLRDPAARARRVLLVCRGAGEERAFTVTVNGLPLAAPDGRAVPADTFYEAGWPLTDAIRRSAGDGRYTIRFTAGPGSATADISEVRLLE